MLLPFQFSSFSKSTAMTSSPMIGVLAPNSPNLCAIMIITFGDKARVLSQAATKAKTVPEFKDVLKLIWSTLPKKAIDNAVKDYSQRLQACVSANGRHFEHIM